MKNILIFTIFLISISVYSQQERFVEVTSSDTVLLKPVSFVYEIKLVSDYTNRDDSASVTEKFNRLSKLLENENYKERVPVNSFNHNANNYDLPGFQITLYSGQEIERLYNLINGLNYYTGSIISAEYESPEPFIAEMLKNIYDRAYSDASYITSLSGNTIGRVISVEDPKSIWDGYGDIYTNDLKKSMKFLFGTNPAEKYKYILKKTYKFELK